jgi:hypothetical protein
VAASLLLKRTKGTAGNDPDPTLGIFKPPPLEIFKPSSQATAVRFALVYQVPGFAATVTLFAQDAATGSWFRIATQGSVAHRVIITRCNTGAHDLWIGLSNITGGNPIQVYMEEVD